jgi:hypothetical protein
MDFSDIRWPVYAIAQREAVKVEDGATVVLDHRFLLTGQATDEAGRLTRDMGLLLFSSEENAERCLVRTKTPAGVVATFRDKDQLRDCIQRFKDENYLVVIFNRYSDGHVIEIDLFLSIVERLL